MTMEAYLQETVSVKRPLYAFAESKVSHIWRQ